jgi:peptide/nickel transport system substrate-binding protein
VIRVMTLICAAMVVVACAPPDPASPSQGTEPREAVVVPQRALVLAIPTEPAVLEPSMNAGAFNADFDVLTNGFLAYLTPEQQPMPYLAEELPTLERGTWKLLPDGRMETTYKLKRTATWQDGAPITAHDFVFAHRVRTDPEVPAHTAEIERRISRVQAVDDYTLFLDWKQPYSYAGMVHQDYMAPLPRHLIEAMYLTEKERFINGPHWRDEYVGSGPYRVESWQQGAEMVLRAFPGFVLGKPPIDQVNIKFITDRNTILASLRAGAIHTAFNMDYEHGRSLEDAAWLGVVEYWRGNPRHILFQMRDWGNTQRAVHDVRVRRALMHAFDREAMVESLYAGKAPVWDVWFDSSDPAFAAVDRAISKYEYDARKAEMLLREAGWIKGPDGIARNAQGAPLNMSILTNSDDQEALIAGDYWKAVGAPTEMLALTPAQSSDGEYRSKFPAASYSRRGLGYDSLPGATSPHISTPENRWSGFNRSGYSNPILDDVLTRALASVEPREREHLYVEAFRAWTADAAINVTHLQPRVIAYPSEVRGPKQPWVGDTTFIWNLWEWAWTR